MANTVMYYSLDHLIDRIILTMLSVRLLPACEDQFNRTQMSTASDVSDADALKASPHHEEKISGLRTFWQRPRGNSPPKAILFLAHGMCHGAEDFFGEPDFAGLPEERRMVAAGLEHGFMVVAVSSTDRTRKMWNPEVDGPCVAHVLQEVLRRELSDDAEIPVFAMGISNGGAFVLFLPHWIRLRAVVCQIMALPCDLLKNVPNLPATLFVHMPRDVRTAEGVKANIALLRGMGVVAEERCCGPRAIDKTFFSTTCGIEASTSARMAEALQTHGIVDAQGMLKEDPRRTRWRDVLQTFGEEVGDTLEADRSPIAEIMNVAWASHELTAEGIDDALLFCERFI